MTSFFIFSLFNIDIYFIYINVKFYELLFRNKIIFIEVYSFFKGTGLPHNQGIQGNTGNFQVEENLRETQGILI